MSLPSSRHHSLMPCTARSASAPLHAPARSSRLKCPRRGVFRAVSQVNLISCLSFFLHHHPLTLAIAPHWNQDIRQSKQGRTVADESEPEREAAAFRLEKARLSRDPVYHFDSCSSTEEESVAIVCLARASMHLCLTLLLTRQAY